MIVSSRGKKCILPRRRHRPKTSGAAEQRTSNRARSTCLASERLETRRLLTVIPLGRLADEPYRLTDVLDTATKVAEYSFVADAGDLVTVTASPLSSADLFLTLHADDAVGISPGLQVAFGDDASATTRDPAITAVVPSSGTYRITVAARAEFGFAPVASQFRPPRRGRHPRSSSRPVHRDRPAAVRSS